MEIIVFLRTNRIGELNGQWKFHKALKHLYYEPGHQGEGENQSAKTLQFKNGIHISVHVFLEGRNLTENYDFSRHHIYFRGAGGGGRFELINPIHHSRLPYDWTSCNSCGKKKGTMDCDIYLRIKIRPWQAYLRVGECFASPEIESLLILSYMSVHYWPSVLLHPLQVFESQYAVLWLVTLGSIKD
jgi:hypothetical protein